MNTIAMDNHEVERNELAEDEEKLQLALQEVADESAVWYDYDDVEDEEDDEALLIDLDAPSSITGLSSSSGYVESGSRGHFMTIDEDSQERRQIPGISIPSQEKTETFTAEKTLALNQALQEILESRIESIQEAIDTNKAKQARLNEGAWADVESKKRGKGRTWGPFRSPFFKSNEADCFPPDNEDTVLKRKSNELQYDSMKEHMNYNYGTKKILLQAIVEERREVLMKPVMNRLEVEIKKSTELQHSADLKGDDVEVLQVRWKALKQSQSEMMQKKHCDTDELEENEKEMDAIKTEMASEEAEYKKRLKLKQTQDMIVTEIEDELRQIRRLTDNEILEDVDSSKIDWMKISKLWFKDSTSWIDCQKAWDFMANPKLNLRPWRKEEETRLLELVEQHEAKNWETVAKELGTCRTPFHCFYHYQSRFNPEFKSRLWKKEEDAKLIEAVKRVRETYNTFSWGKVSALVNSRSVVECRARYARIGEDRNFGRWNSSEDARLMMAVNLLGQNWWKVAKFMGNRTVHQCKQRYTQSLNPELNHFHFTYEEDQKLLRLMKRFGRQWVKIATCFKGRTDTMIKGRVRALEKWKKETDWWESLDDFSKNMLLGKNLTVSERKCFEGRWQEFYQMKLGIADKDYIMQERDKRAGLDPDIIPSRPPIHLKYSKFQRGFTQRKNASWSQRLSIHHQLLKNLKQRFENEQAQEQANPSGASDEKRIAAIRKVFKNNSLKDGDLTEEEKKMREVMNNALSDTASQAQGNTIPPERMNRMLSALNLHFLGESTINVKEILKSTQSEQLSGLKIAQSYRKRVNLRLRRILAKNKWIYLRGRYKSKRFAPFDKRNPEEIKKEGEDWDKCVPAQLIRRLGGDSFTLMKSIKQKMASAKERKKNLPHFEDDPGYKARLNVLKRKVNEVRSLWHLSQEEKDKLEKTAIKKIPVLRREFHNAYELKHELIQGELETGEIDSDYIKSAEKNNSLNIHERVSNSSSSSSASPTVTSSSSPSSDPLFSSMFLASTKDMLGDLGESESGDGESNVTYGSINYLPPSLSTLTGLRSLLLYRQQLIATAGNLYNPDNYKRIRKRQLHIILDSDDEEKEKDDNEGSEEGMKAKERKVERLSSIKAIEVVDKNEGQNYNEGSNTSSWFKLPEENPITEGVFGIISGIDKELEKRGNLPSTSFAPYGSKTLKLLNLPNVEKDCKPKTDFDTSTKDTWFEESELQSNYEVMFGPTATNVTTMLRLNPDIKFAKPIPTVNDDEAASAHGNDKNLYIVDKPIESIESLNTVDKGVELVESPNTVDIQVELIKNPKTVDKQVELIKNPNTADMQVELIESSDTVDKRVELIENPKTVDKRVELIKNPNTVDIQVGLIKNPKTVDMQVELIESPNTVDKQVELIKNPKTVDMQVELIESPNTVDKQVELIKIPNTVDKQVELIESPNTGNKQVELVKRFNIADKPLELIGNVEAGELLSGQRFESVYKYKEDQQIMTEKGDKNKILQTIKGFKKAEKDKDLKNVVVVGLNQDKNEIVHYKADKVEKSLTKASSDSERNKTKPIIIDHDQKLNTQHIPPEQRHEKLLVSLFPMGHQKRGPKGRCTNKLDAQRLVANMPQIVNRMIEKTQNMANSENVVVVGVDPNTGKAVHFKGGEKAKFNPDTAGQSQLPQQPFLQDLRKPENMTEEELKACMASVRATDEYQRLLARFRALFMWPVLMSTTKPGSEIIVSNVDTSQRHPKKKRPKGRPRLYPVKISPEANIAKREKKQIQKKKTNGGAKKTKPRLDYSKLLPKSDRPVRHKKRLHYESPDELKHKRSKKSKLLPKWWKNAITEVMMKKKEIEGGNIFNDEIDISGDEDFIDKGDYSDDEWLAELREEEAKKAAEEGTSGAAKNLISEGEEKGMDTAGFDDDGLLESNDDDDGVQWEEDRSKGDGEDMDEDNKDRCEKEKGVENGVNYVNGSENEEFVKDGNDDGVNNGYSFYIMGKDGKEEEVMLEVMD